MDSIYKILESLDNLEEKWKGDADIEATGEYADKTVAELRKMYNALKKSGPHKAGSEPNTKMKQIAFAIRAKTGFGKVGESEAVSENKESGVKVTNIEWKAEPGVDLPSSVKLTISAPIGTDNDKIWELVGDKLEDTYGYTVVDYDMQFEESVEEGRYDGPNSSCCDAPIKNYENGMGICSDCGEHASPHEDEEDVDEDCYANEPEEEYKDTQYMTRDLAGGLNKEKNAHPKAADGDNPMALEAKLRAELKSMYESKKKTVETEKQKGVDGKACWKGYKRMGTKKKGGKTVDNCVKA